MQPITVLLTFLLLVVNSAFISIIGVMGLPRNNPNNLHDNNNKHGGSNNNKGSHIASVVTLTDEFPCEGESTHQSTAATATTLSSRVSFTGNSFAELNNLQIDNSNSNSSPSPLPSSLSTAAKSSLTTRGGGGSSTDVVMDDDTIDQMVGNLIAGLDIDVGDDEESVDEEEESEEEEEEQVVIPSVDKNEDEAIDESAEEEAEPIATKDDDTTSDSSAQPQQSKPPATTTPSSPHNNNNRPPLPLATPTNAYYRFLVRRGPKGHILASLTLISIQWIHVYIPLLYKSAASILLKLHIYDPKVLWQRDRQRREEEERRRRGIYPQIMKKKRGVMGSVLFSSSKNSQRKKERNAQQQRADLHASQKLKQLYKAIKSGERSGGALSEVKYRYLSVAFRRKYGLGKEYRVEKPMSFLGEVVEGDAHQKQRVMMEEEAVVDEVIILDGEGEEDEVEVKSTTAAAAAGVSGGQSTTKQQKKKRKKMNDWVVQAFGTRKQPPPPKSGSRASSSSNGKQFESTLWTKVDNSAILQAAWESLAAEQLAWQKKKRTKQRGSGGDEENDDEYDEEDEESLSGIGSKSSSSGYGASKMFQSVMTRVGSNGRLPGAYPMDAPPIEECANSRGVLDFARRYGYGDWKESSIYYGEDSEDDGDSFGGGNLFSSAEPASQGRKARRKKQRSFSVTDALDDADGKRRKRRKKASSSVKLGMSGGEITLGNNRVSFEFGVSSSPRSSRRQRDPPAISPASSSRRMELNDIKSKLSERSVLFTSDTRVKAPTQLLNNSRDRLRKKNEDES
jgi:hypothetical protein